MMKLLNYLLAPALKKYEHWALLANSCQEILDKNIYTKIELLLGEAYSIDSERDDLIEYLKYLGWTVKDNFAADWSSVPVAKAFAQRLLYAWTDYSLQPNGLGTKQSSDFLSYILGFPVLVVPLYSRAYDEELDKGKMPNRLVTYGKFLYNKGEINSSNVINNKLWITTHVEIRIQESDLIASDVITATPESLLTSLYYAIAPIQNVVASVNIVTNLYADLHNYSFVFDDIYIDRKD